MANEKEYKKKSEDERIRKYDIYSWYGFNNLFNVEFYTKKDDALNNKLYLDDYIWRGHQREDWGLISSFDREFKINNEDYIYKPDRDTLLKRHLNSFVYAIRSRLKEFGLTVREIRTTMKNKSLNKNHIWALGQHYDLKTPLLDWCYSPYIAAYFAFQKKTNDEKNKEHRIVWGLNFKQVCDNYTKAGIFNTSIEYFDPMSSEHPRLINQRGLFTITKNGEVIKKVKKNDMDIEGIIEKSKCAGCNGPWLIKLIIIDNKKNRDEFLRRLNAMNINHISLFPEIKGAAEFSNIGLELDEYARFHGQGW